MKFQKRYAVGAIPWACAFYQVHNLLEPCPKRLSKSGKFCLLVPKLLVISAIPLDAVAKIPREHSASLWALIVGWTFLTIPKLVERHILPLSIRVAIVKNGFMLRTLWTN